jgi:cytoskeletal protein CcmA (bactofilin family)
MRGNLSLPTLITLKGDTVVEKNLTVTEDLEIQGGDLTTNQATFNLLNTTATTVNFAGAGTTVNIGATTGTTRVKNDLDVDGDVNIDGGDLKTTAPTFNLLPDTATTVNFAGAATSLVLGATTGTTKIRNDLDVDGGFHIGKDLDVDGDINIDGGDLTVSTTTFNLANTTATTVNFAGAATNIEIGSSTGTTNVNNNLDVDGDVNIDGGDLTVSTTTFNLANTTATTVNFAGAATNIEIGSSTGKTNINNNLDIDGDVNIDGGDLTVSTETFNLANSTAKNVNFAGEATNIEIGSQDGVTNVNNNFKVDGDTTFGNRLTVDGIVDVNNSLYVEGETRLSQSLEVENSVKVQKELDVEGDTNITRDLNVGGYIKGGQLIGTTIDCGSY